MTETLPRPEYGNHHPDDYPLTDGPAFMHDFGHGELLVTSRYQTIPGFCDYTYITVWDPTGKYLALRMRNEAIRLDENQIHEWATHNTKYLQSMSALPWSAIRHRRDEVDWYPFEEPNGPQKFGTNNQRLDWSRPHTTIAETEHGYRFKIVWQPDGESTIHGHEKRQLLRQPGVAIGRHLHAATKNLTLAFEEDRWRAGRVSSIDITYTDGLPQTGPWLLDSDPGYVVPYPFPEYAYGDHPTKYEGVPVTPIRGCLPQLSAEAYEVAAARLYRTAEDLRFPGRLAGYLVPTHLLRPEWFETEWAPLVWDNEPDPDDDIDSWDSNDDL